MHRRAFYIHVFSQKCSCGVLEGIKHVQRENNSLNAKGGGEQSCCLIYVYVHVLAKISCSLHRTTIPIVLLVKTVKNPSSQQPSF